MSDTQAVEYLVVSFYKFTDLAQQQLTSVQTRLESKATDLQIRGLIILGHEGFNATLSGADQPLQTYLQWFSEEFETGALELKLSRSPHHPFRQFKVKVRSEIVTLGKPEVKPLKDKSSHLTPQEWHQQIQNDDVVVLDTRNWYESKIGKFKKAIAPPISDFNEFPDYLKSQDIAKEKKVLIYCTGGIRCEKAIVEMRNQGFKNVFQLDGGILNYLEQFPNQEFEGECFVFDHRLAVDQKLRPTKTYKMCPHCGQPSDVPMSCKRCGDQTSVCPQCLQQAHLQTCSKNCAHHYLASPSKQGRKQKQGYRYLITQERAATLKGT